MSEIISIAKPGQSVSEAVKESLQQSAQAKQLVEMKKQATAKIGNVMNAIMQSWSLGPDHAVSASLDYSVGLAQGHGVTKEDYLKGFERVWASHVAQAEEVREEQRKMVLNVVRQVMAQKLPVPPQLVAQMQTLAIDVPEDIQAYLDKPPSSSPQPE